MSFAHQHQVLGGTECETEQTTRLEKDTIHHFSSNLSIFPLTLA